jgi:2-C-methyl-D-erythritol 2,4-cyclodiphosphate synthase
VAGRDDGAAAQPGATRTGFGTDRHAFGPGDGLRLAGIEIPGAPRLHGHSDGDAALHAVAGALLGAAGLGELGELYPADDRTARGSASSGFVRDVVTRLSAAGWRPASLDLTIRAARPVLAPHVPAMRNAIAGLLGVDVPAVSVKASTGNLSGDAGAGRVVEAEAIATIVGVGREAGAT